MNQKNQMETFEEGYRNFDLKPLTEEERQLIENIVDAVWTEVVPRPIVEGGELLDFRSKTPRGQRRKLQLFGEEGAEKQIKW